jgi:tRNA/rRNA methyltransferase
MAIRDTIAFVLFKPKSPGNIGAAARALKNMGFADLRLVAPARFDAREAAAMAVHGGDILARAGHYPDLATAIADCTLSFGTTAHKGPYRSAARPIREAAQALVSESAANRIAIIFGPEDFGLTNDELKLCQRLLTIPSAPEYPSLNLAQAVIIVAYEIMMAARGTPESSKVEEYAAVPAVDAMFQRMARALIEIGFLSADNPDHIMYALRVLLGRCGLTTRELDILNGIANQIGWFADGGRETLALKREAGKKFR